MSPERSHRPHGRDRSSREGLTRRQLLSRVGAAAAAGIGSGWLLESLTYKDKRAASAPAPTSSPDAGTAAVTSSEPAPDASRPEPDNGHEEEITRLLQGWFGEEMKRLAAEAPVGVVAEVLPGYHIRDEATAQAALAAYMRDCLRRYGNWGKDLGTMRVRWPEYAGLARTVQEEMVRQDREKGGTPVRVPLDVVAGVIHVESEGLPRNPIGLGTSGLARNNPAENIKIGMKALARLYRKYEQWGLVFFEYNGGEWVTEAAQKFIFHTTQNRDIVAGRSANELRITPQLLRKCGVNVLTLEAFFAAHPELPLSQQNWAYPFQVAVSSHRLREHAILTGEQ